MSSILDTPLLKEAVTSCHYFWEAGWGEFHAGNLSYLLSEEELADLKPFFRDDPIRVPVAFDTCGLEMCIRDRQHPLLLGWGRDRWA